jgi:copper(I)-binding protein
MTDTANANGAALRRRVVMGGVLAIIARATDARAHDFRRGAIHVGHPWARPADVGAFGETYMALVNRGAGSDRLVGAAADIAMATRIVGEQADAIDLAPGRPVALRPGGRHIRLERLTRRLVVGDRFDLMLHFARAASFIVEVVVEELPGH